ncbi:16S rRNA (uracil(1498)-N(3))-methyltransferase [Maribacter sp. 4G9]|uniref:16S rRNA (uracil(1498)-N(3))-methyltransferase n=1 Tax=Maribacter sp. 4G9 TaxID=1889777 RepID=UPI000C147787|nr:16S rRNA (uracil(1498)-N(3))-methyltransferase [Maribacter sp. 4G9]PIB38783.1 16S rRNA (uracil(1498)-N(3))-methyltransferase [Maribacter sp. 4G9]
MQLFYNPHLDETSSQFSFDTEESKHMVRVLRKKVNDEVLITNGRGLMLSAKITDSNPKKCAVEITGVKKVHRKNHWLHMIVAPTKMNDRFEWFLEKATEIGVNEITPVLCEHSERKTIKLDRYTKVIQSAMKQSMQAYLPKLNDLTNFNEIIDIPREGGLFIAHCDDSEKYELKRRVIPDKPITILIGPEGDFSAKEIKVAKEKGYLPVSMGRNRLRTETAAIVACTTVAIINNG